MKTDNRNIFAIKSFLREYLDLRKDKDNELETIDSIRKGVEFKGANLWILIFAIFMASLGLNVNSTAVIIGKPGTIYTANASEANAMKKRGTLTFVSSSSCGNLILPSR